MWTWFGASVEVRSAEADGTIHAANATAATATTTTTRSGAPDGENKNSWCNLRPVILIRLVEMEKCLELMDF